MAEMSLDNRSTADGPALAAGVVGLVALAVGALLLVRGTAPETLRLALRSTARLSSALLWVAFSASALATLFGIVWPLERRRYLGLAFGGVHLVHGALVLTLAFLLHGGDLTGLSQAPEVAGGVFVYLVIVVMMLTSRDGAVRALGVARWRRLHRFGIWLLFLVFLLDYSKLAIGGSRAHWLAVGAFLGAWGLRIAARRRRRRPA